VDHLGFAFLQDAGALDLSNRKYQTEPKTLEPHDKNNSHRKSGVQTIQQLDHNHLGTIPVINK
jgi:hypothetical protein